MRHLRFALPLLITFLFLASSANADIRLGFNDRWDNNWSRAQRIHEVGGTEARVFVTVTRAVDEGDSYWTWLRQQVRGLLSRDVQPYFVISDVPSYGGTNSYNALDWKRTAAGLVARYGSTYPIEIGNEPNNVSYGNQLAPSFAVLFRAVYTTIRGLAPDATILSAAPTKTSGPEGQAWLTQFHDLTADLSYKVALHLYGWTEGNKATYSFVRNLYPDRPASDFWVTELGAKIGPSTDAALQADILYETLHYLAGRGTKHVSVHTFYPYYGCSYSLVCGGQPKPAYYSVATAMREINGEGALAKPVTRRERISDRCHGRIRRHSHHHHKRTRHQRYRRCVRRLL